MKFMIFVVIIGLVACAIAQHQQPHQQQNQRQDYQQQQNQRQDYQRQDYQPQHHATQQQQQQQQQQYQPQQQLQQAPQHRQYKIDDLSTTTWIPILAYNKEQGQDGSYKASYKTGNKIDAHETGYIKDISEAHPNGVLVQQGEYSYEAPDGSTVNVQYTADERGFRAVGDHIPTPPPVPLEIQKGLDQIYAGIKLNAEKAAQRAQSDPDFAKAQQSRAEADYNGQYYPS